MSNGNQRGHPLRSTPSIGKKNLCRGQSPAFSFWYQRPHRTREFISRGFSLGCTSHPSGSRPIYQPLSHSVTQKTFGSVPCPNSITQSSWFLANPFQVHGPGSKGTNTSLYWPERIPIRPSGLTNPIPRFPVPAKSYANSFSESKGILSRMM